MKLTSRGEYATRAVFYLARKSRDEGFTTIATIARENDMPRKYLEQILNELRGAEILESREGSRGGYRMKADPADLTLGTVLRLVDGPMAPIGCVAGDPDFCCEIEANCGTRPFWQVMTRVLDHLVDAVTFDDLIAHNRGERAMFGSSELQISLLPDYAQAAPVAGERPGPE